MLFTNSSLHCYGDQNFQDTKPVQTALLSANSTSTKSAGPLTRPKVKKRKTIDFNVLVDYDLKGLEEKKGVKASGGVDASKITSEVQPSTFQKASLPPVDNKPDTLNPAHQDLKSDQIPAEELLVGIVLCLFAIDHD